MCRHFFFVRKECFDLSFGIFVTIVMVVGGIIFLAGIIYAAHNASTLECESPWTGYAGLIVFLAAMLFCFYCVSTVKSVEKGRTPIEISYIDAYDVNGLQEYEVTTVDGDVYKTDYRFLSGPFVYVEESETDEFALYKAEYRREGKVFGITLDDGESPAEYIILTVPSEYWKLHTTERHEGTTRIFSSDEYEIYNGEEN